MKKINLFVIFTFIICSQIIAQNLPKMNFIEGGLLISGKGVQYDIDSIYDFTYYSDNCVDSIKNNNYRNSVGIVFNNNFNKDNFYISNFYISETEVTNLQYKYFLLDSLLDDNDKNILKQTTNKDKINILFEKIKPKALKLNLLPDSSVWFPKDSIMSYYFFKHEFDNYPVLGVSWFQANKYCSWLTNKNNDSNNIKVIPNKTGFRLPTEQEWEFAAYGLSFIGSNGIKQNGAEEIDYEFQYPWDGISFWGSNPKNIASLNANFSFMGENIADDFFYTSPVKSYSPNGYGLYDMAGNVSEWTFNSFVKDKYSELEFKTIKGGSWKDNFMILHCGSRCGLNPYKGYSRVGFRIAQTKIGS